MSKLAQTRAVMDRMDHDRALRDGNDDAIPKWPMTDCPVCFGSGCASCHGVGRVKAYTFGPDGQRQWIR